MSAARAASLASNFVRKALVVTEMDMRKIRRDPMELITRAIQPALWLVVFGSVMDRIRMIPSGDIRYLDFMTPGILSQSLMFISIFYGMSIIFERDLGMAHKLLVSPAPRTALVAGKALAAGVRSMTQGVVIYVLAALVGVNLVIGPQILAVLLVVILGAAVFTLMSLIIASIVRSRDRFMGIGQMITMPLFFASNAIYPISLMPTWLQAIAFANPLTYVVDAMRGLMVAGVASQNGTLVDIAVLAGMALVLLLVAGRLYPRVGE